MDNISPVLGVEKQNKAWWMGHTNGTFLVKATWDLMRYRQEKNDLFDMVDL